MTYVSCHQLYIPEYSCEIVWECSYTRDELLSLQHLYKPTGDRSTYGIQYTLYSFLFQEGIVQLKVIQNFVLSKWTLVQTFQCFKGGGYIRCPKSNPYFRDITWNVLENIILHDIFRVVSRFPRFISCYIAEIQFPLGLLYILYLS